MKETMKIFVFFYYMENLAQPIDLALFCTPNQKIAKVCTPNQTLYSVKSPQLKIQGKSQHIKGKDKSDYPTQCHMESGLYPRDTLTHSHTS